MTRGRSRLARRAPTARWSSCARQRKQLAAGTEPDVPAAGQAADDPQIAGHSVASFRQLHAGFERTVWAVCGTEGELERFDELWAEYGGQARRRTAAGTNAWSGFTGFLIEPAKLVVVTDSEIFGHPIAAAAPLKSPTPPPPARRLKSIFDLSVGDYVVHLQQGIGRYLGLKVCRWRRARRARPRENRGRTECLVIEFGTRSGTGTAQAVRAGVGGTSSANTSAPARPSRR